MAQQYSCPRCHGKMSSLKTLRAHCKKGRPCTAHNSDTEALTPEDLLQHCASLRQRPGRPTGVAVVEPASGPQSEGVNDSSSPSDQAADFQELTELLKQIVTQQQRLIAQQEQALTVQHLSAMHDELVGNQQRLAAQQQQLSEDLQQLKQQLVQAPPAPPQHVTHNVFNQTNSITINVLGSEDMSYINPEELDYKISTAMEKSVKGFTKFLLILHFDMRAPQNWNVRYDPDRKSLEMYHPCGWQPSETLEDGLLCVSKLALRRFHDQVRADIGVEFPRVHQEDLGRFVREVVAPAGQFWDCCTWLDPSDPDLNPQFYKDRLSAGLRSRREVLFKHMQEVLVQHKVMQQSYWETTVRDLQTRLSPSRV
jgi:hypothetical protein